MFVFKEIIPSSSKETYTYKGHSFDIEQPGEWCSVCEEGILNGKDLKETDKHPEQLQELIPQRM